jgi:hypothetical protein
VKRGCACNVSAAVQVEGGAVVTVRLPLESAAGKR